MKYIVYLAAISLLAVGLIDPATFLELPATVALYAPISVKGLFVAMVHALALLTVAQQRNIFGNFKGILGRYPEGIALILILSGWTVIATLTGPSILSFATGFIFAMALAVCYAAVRIVGTKSLSSAKLSLPTTNYSAAVMSKLTARSIYLLRIFLAVISAFGLLSFALNGFVMGWLPIFAFVVLCVAALLATYGILSERTLTQGAGKTAKLAIAAQMGAKPVETAIYYSGAAKSKHLAPIALAEQFEKSCIPTAIICREAGAHKALVKAPHDHLLLCPAISALDGVAQPTLKTIFYVNDAAKNGHFVRFNNYTHILRTTGTIAAGTSLPQSCDVYDIIIAPNEEKAAAWRAAANADMAKRIITLGKNSTNSSYLPSSKYPSGKPLLALHLGDLLDNDETRSLVPKLINLIAAIAKLDTVRMDIWFPSAKNGARSPLLRVIHREVERMGAAIATDDAVADFALKRQGGETVLSGSEIDPVLGTPSSEAGTTIAKNDEQIQTLPITLGKSTIIAPLVAIRTGSPAEAANAADFLVATDSSELDAMRSTGKPLLWFGLSEAPTGFLPVEGDAAHLAAVLEQAWSAPVAQEVTGFQTGHFESLTALVTAMSKENMTTQKEGTSSC